MQYSEEVLAVFKSYKLDDTQASRKKMEELKTGGEHVYFAKFLTSEKVPSSFYYVWGCSEHAQSTHAH